MEAERWQRLEHLFGEARQLPPEQRTEFLDDACADDVDLRRKVESLIVHAEQPATFVARAIEAEVQRSSGSLVGERVGAYRIAGELGQGGMGTVYLGERDDAEFRQQVAIKVLRGGPAHPELVTRFRGERQILAALRHPNIASLLDGGTTEAGLPFVVMEYINGRPVDLHCDEHRLSIRERIELFVEICAAVQFAHRNLIVHRDLKPGNILVTADGTPKLLDFGIAKLLDAESMPHTVAATATVARLLTPEYASPEQFRGEPITTASDVYSLGVLLYELLSGRRPYRVDTGSFGDMERIVCQEQTVPPSVALGREADAIEAVARARRSRPHRLRRELGGDLDNIVLMALRKEPERRYGSAAQLAEDLGRYLAGEPVTAQADSWAYRARKFVGRHRVGVIAAGSVALLVIAFGVTTVVQNVRIQREKAAAEYTTAFLVDMFQSADPYFEGGRELTAAEILRRGEEKLQAAVEAEPRVRVQLMDTIGDVYRRLGEYDRARPLFEEALAIGLERFGPEDPRTIDVQNSLGIVLADVGELEQARTLFEEILPISRRASGSDDPQTLSILDNLAGVYASIGLTEEAETLYLEALEGRRRVLGPEHDKTLVTINNLGGVYIDRAQYERAVTLYRDLLEISRRVRGDQHPETTTILSNLAFAHVRLGNLDQGERFHAEVLENRRKQFGEDHIDTLLSANNLGRVYARAGRYAEAEPLLASVLERARSVVGDDHTFTLSVMANLGELLTDVGRLDEAGPLLEEAVSSMRENLPPTHPRLGKVIRQYGRYLTAAGRFDDAEASLLEARELLIASVGREHDMTIEAERDLADLYDARQE